MKLKPGTNGCKVLSGVLLDPYTGDRIEFDSSRPMEVQGDHVVSLAQAWRSGASVWPLERRQRFANDPLNLIAVDGPTNQAKGDKPFGQWRPPNRGYECSLARITVTVLTRYGLTIHPSQRSALSRILADCPISTNSVPAVTAPPALER